MSKKRASRLKPFYGICEWYINKEITWDEFRFRIENFLIREGGKIFQKNSGRDRVRTGPLTKEELAYNCPKEYPEDAKTPGEPTQPETETSEAKEEQGKEEGSKTEVVAPGT